MKRLSRRGFVYLVENTRAKHLKIGWSSDPEKRLRALKNATVDELRIVATFPGTMQDERLAHSLFHPRRIRCEWFHAAPEIIALFSLSDADRRRLLDRQRDLILKAPKPTSTPQMIKRSVTIKTRLDMKARDLVGARGFSELVNEGLEWAIQARTVSILIDEYERTHGGVITQSEIDAVIASARNSTRHAPPNIQRNP